MKAVDFQQEMLATVARALGPDLLAQVAFVGGCTTALLVTDPFTRELVRHTEDVDIIVQVAGRMAWYDFETTLRSRGFVPDQEVICRMRLDDLSVDFMPTHEEILGFTNPGYQAALEAAQDHPLTDELTIRVITPPYFPTTKIEAFRSRGNNDPLASRDIEDLLNLVDGRASLLDELKDAAPDVRTAIVEGIRELLDHRDFEYAVQSASMRDRDREKLIFTRLEAFTEFK